MAYLLLLLSFVPLASLFLSFLLARRRGKAGLPPGRLGPPLVGETLQLISAYKTENPEPFIDERVWRHGRVFTTHVFGETTVFSTDPEVNRQVLQGEGRLFECSYPSSISTLLGRHSLLLMKGALHRRMHSLTLTRFASATAIRDSLLPDIDRLIRLNLDSWAGRRIRLLDQAKKITFELTMKQLMSVDPGEWTESLRKEYLLVIDGFFSLPLYLPFTTYGKALQARKKVAEALKLVVRERKREAKEEEENGTKTTAATTAAAYEGMKNRRKDMLDCLLEAEEGLSEEEVVDFMLALLVAGYETTSTMMTLAAKFVAEDPRVLALLKEEQEGIMALKNDEKAPLDWSDYKAMPFTQCVINETLRMANIIGGIFRRAVSDVQVKGYTIPKGCKIFASFRAVHLNPDHYEDARSFNPWRWQQKNNAATVQPSSAGGASVFTPFGGGPRLCPGYELARVEISVFLHHLVTRFSWDAAEEDRLVYFPTTRTLKGYPINVRRRTEA